MLELAAENSLAMFEEVIAHVENSEGVQHSISTMMNVFDSLSKSTN